MSRLSSVLTLLVALQTSLAVGRPSTEIVVTRPTAKSPATDLGEPDLQERYDGMWQVFETAVAKTSDDLTNTVEDLKKQAQDAANLDLALHWTEHLESFNKTGSVKWDRAGHNKTSWNSRFGKAPFPDEYATALMTIKRGYSDASDTLRKEYDDLVETLTKRGLLDKAKQIRSEGQAVLSGKPVEQNESKEEQAKPDPAPRPLKKRLEGRWTHPSSEFIYFYLPDGSFHEDWKKTGETNDVGKLQTEGPDVAEVKFSDGRTVHALLAGDDAVVLLTWDSSGNRLPATVLERQKPKERPNEAKMYQGHAYIFVGAKVSYPEATQKCWKMGGHLVLINSQEEHRFVFALSQGQPCWFDRPRILDNCDQAPKGVIEDIRPPLQRTMTASDMRSVVWCIGLNGTDWWSGFSPEDRSARFNFICEWDR